MARLSTASIPKGAADQSTAIVGLATNSNIALGEVFQRAKLAIPPVVASGSRVTMIVRTSFLEASASGIALESGIEGQEIKVRNESSKRVVSGKVTANGTVIINPGGGSL